ncbi:MAG: EutN/CcmL family microcompartment protein [Coprococcus sp.]
MLICKVVGHVWATKKEEGLEGLKLMVVQEIDGTGRKKGNTFVAADVVGAGIGEQVLTVSGSTARKALEEIQCRWMLRLWPLSILLK